MSATVVRLRRCEVHHVAMPLREPWQTSTHTKTAIDSILVRVVDEEGADGWGEAAPHGRPLYSPEWAPGAFELLRSVAAPMLLGVELHGPHDVRSRLAGLRGNNFAKAAVESAVWDLFAVRSGRSLSELLGGTKDRAEVGADLGIAPDLETLLAAVDDAVAAGYRRVKLKIGPGWHVEPARAVRERHPHVALQVDGNAAFGPSDLAIFEQLDELGLLMIEQPLRHDDLVDHAELQARLATPVCLDESILSREHLRQALELGSCRIVNVKPGRVGGLAEARDVIEACAEAGVDCWIGGMLESAVGAGACVALATLPGVTMPSDIFPTARFYAEDLGQPGPDVRASAEGVFAVPLPGPGHGARPVAERLAAWAAQSAELDARDV